MNPTAQKITKSSMFVLVVLPLIVAARAQPPVATSPEPPRLTLSLTQLPPKAVQDKVLLLLKAIEDDSYGDFSTAITDDFKAALPLKAFQSMREPLVPQLQKGYDLSYMGEVKKGDYTTYVLKIVFRDQKFDRNINEVMMTLTLKDIPAEQQATEKVSGLFLD